MDTGVILMPMPLALQVRISAVSLPTLTVLKIILISLPAAAASSLKKERSNWT